MSASVNKSHENCNCEGEVCTCARGGDLVT
jgi:hypothetical protein